MKKKFVMITAAAFLMSPAALARIGTPLNLSCPNCQQIARNRQAQALPVDSTLQEGFNVAQLLQRSMKPTVRYTAQVASAEASQVPSWDGQGERPGAFQRPWNLATSKNFDPSFVTPFYSEQTGPINSPFAPWNLFVPPTYAAQYYKIGMATLGLQPVAAAPMPGI